MITYLLNSFCLKDLNFLEEVRQQIPISRQRRPGTYELLNTHMEPNEWYTYSISENVDITDILVGGVVEEEINLWCKVSIKNILCSLVITIKFRVLYLKLFYLQ